MLFFVGLYMCLTAYAACPYLIVFRPVYIHERDSGMYFAGAFLLAKTISDIILYSILAFVFGTIAYALVGLNWSVYGFYLATCLVELFTATSAIAFTSVISPTLEVALVFASFLIGTAVIFSGFFVPVFNIPSYWLWLHDVSFLRYALDCFVVNNFGDCDLSLVKASCSSIDPPPVTSECTGLLLTVYGPELICEEGLPDKNLSLLYLLLLGVGFRILSLILLRIRKQVLKRVF